MLNRKKSLSQLSIHLILIVLCILIIYPFWMLVSVSLSSEADIAYTGYRLIPKNIDWSAYRYVLKNPAAIIQAYKTTALFSIVGTLLATLLMAMCAYPISKKSFKPRKYINFYLYFTMLFSGGLVPSYILITRYLHLDDTIWAYIFPALISVWHVFMMRTFFSNLPNEIFESVLVDGGNEFLIFFRFVIPLSKPVIATVALMTFLNKWNDWNTSMLYINDSKLHSLQYLLQEMMKNIELLQNAQTESLVGQMIDMSKIPAETARMAMAVIVAGPALVVFPFFQKYFVKGLTVGSVKG